MKDSVHRNSGTLEKATNNTMQYFMIHVDSEKVVEYIVLV